MPLTIDRTTWQSPNHDARPAPGVIGAIVIHSCEGKPAGNEERSSLPWLCNPAAKVSSHYYITRAGLTYQLVADDRRAWHAGASQLNGHPDLNNWSIGIELEHREKSAAYPPAQIAALTLLCNQLMARYAIPVANVVTHRAIALPLGRKDDPTDWPAPDFLTWRALL